MQGKRAAKLIAMIGSGRAETKAVRKSRGGGWHYSRLHRLAMRYAPNQKQSSHNPFVNAGCWWATISQINTPNGGVMPMATPFEWLLRAAGETFFDYNNSPEYTSVGPSG